MPLRKRGCSENRALPKAATRDLRDGAQPSRVRHLKIAVLAALFAGLALSPKLWFGGRLYPLSPVFRFLGTIPAGVEATVYVTLLATLAAIAIVARPAKWIAWFVLLAIVMVLFDQSRLQPWLYQYLMMLAAVAMYDGLAWHDGERHPALNACRLMVVCIYIWSGLQKANADFMMRGFPSLIAPFTRSLPHSIAATMDSAGYVVPFIHRNRDRNRPINAPFPAICHFRGRRDARLYLACHRSVRPGF